MSSSTRNAERKREKSRKDAQDRRRNETYIFHQLCSLLPLSTESRRNHTGRLGVVRVATAICRLRAFVRDLGLSESWLSASGSLSSFSYSEDLMQDLLDGSLLLLVDYNGCIVYASSSAWPTLGIAQTEIIGRQLFDYLHPDDAVELHAVCPTNLGVESNPRSYATVMRFRCAVTPTGRSLSLRSSMYKTFRFDIRFRSTGGNLSSDINGAFLMFGQEIARSLGAATGLQSHLMFSRHSVDMKISQIDKQMLLLIGRRLETVRNQSFYALVHPADLSAFSTAMRYLYTKGKASTGYYRLSVIGRSGVLWVQTEASISTYSSRQATMGRHILCIHNIVGLDTNSPPSVDSNHQRAKVNIYDSGLCATLKQTLAPIASNPAYWSTSPSQQRTITVPLSAVQVAANGHFSKTKAAVHDCDDALTSVDLSQLSPFVNFQDLVSLQEDGYSVHVSMQRPSLNGTSIECPLFGSHLSTSA